MALKTAPRLAFMRKSLPSPVRNTIRSYNSARPGPTAHFYKTFTRPIAKVLLMAVFTYQFAYWGWRKLEADEIRAETDATIRHLEGKVEEYRKKTAEELKEKKKS